MGTGSSDVEQVPSGKVKLTKNWLMKTDRLTRGSDQSPLKSDDDEKIQWGEWGTPQAVGRSSEETERFQMRSDGGLRLHSPKYFSYSAS